MGKTSHRSTRPRHPRAAHFISAGLFKRVRSFRELEARIEALDSRQDRGDALEVFAEAYLATQKIYEAESVWPARTVPFHVRNKLALPRKDLGVDGVYRTWSGQHNGYQVKFRSGRPALTYKELSTFFGLTERVDQRVLFTNCVKLPPVTKARKDFFCIRGTDLDRLTKDDFQAIENWLQGLPFSRVRKTPLPHQEEALQAILPALKKHNRVTTVMACGTGKTLLALWLAEQRKAKRILVLEPSLALIRQTLHEWLNQTAWQKPRCLIVCSDPTVTRQNEDEPILKPEDLDFPVTTEVKDVRAFLRALGSGVQIVFSTYQSAEIVGKAIRGSDSFDIVIFDEAHKSAGRQGAKFSYALEDKRVPAKKRIFLTATPRHYALTRTKKESDKTLVYSMDDVAVYGPIIHELSFAKAAKRGIICDFKVLISVVTSKMVNDDMLKRGEVLHKGDVLRARSVANQIAIQQACKEHEIDKLFSFHNRVASARDFTSESTSSIKAHLRGWETFHVNGAMATADREELMRAFREADRAIMSNARCLTEGVDVPAVDLVAFLSPKKSRVDIVQATGRAMRKDKGKTAGYVLLPIFLEISAKESIEEALERTNLEEVWNVLNALQEQDDTFKDIIREMREERGRKKGFDDSRLREKVEVLGPRVLLKHLRKAITIELIDRLGFSWDERYGELKRYKDAHGNCNVPQVWPDNPQLGVWVNSQRTAEKNGHLLLERVARLEKLGFVWDAREAEWVDMLDELKRYKHAHGHCKIPLAWPDNPQLGTWVVRQRSEKKKGKLSEERSEQLDKLGFIWDARDNWEQKFHELKRFKEVHGDCNVPQGWSENLQLANWVLNQRKAKKNGTLSEERAKQLDKLGFIWSRHDAPWEQMCGELARYKVVHGDCNVPTRYPDNPLLGKWVFRQRHAKEKGILSEDRIERLDKLGFTWDPQDAIWQQRFAELKRYKEAYGHCNVPQKLRGNLQLANWVGTQRNKEKTGQLSEQRKTRLDKLGFTWDPQDAIWQQRFAELKRYKEAYGHCNVPQKWRGNLQLANWVGTQRNKKKNGQLSEQRKTRLEKLGVEWSVR